MSKDFDEPEFPFDEGTEEEQGRKSRYLSGAATLKDDLQAIYQMQRELGQTIWTLHQLVNAVQVGSSHLSSSFVTAHTGMATEISKIQEANAEFEANMEQLLQGSLEEVTEVTQNCLVEIKAHRAKWDALMPKLGVAIEATLKQHGIDATTLQAPNTELLEEVRGAKLRRERIVNALIGAVVAIMANVVIWAYAQVIRSETQDANKVIMEKLEKQHESIKSLENELKVHAKVEDNKTK